jgi:hypothetical protein
VNDTPAISRSTDGARWLEPLVATALLILVAGLGYLLRGIP